jgi:hypothetical protein
MWLHVGKKQPASNVPRGDKEIGRRVTYMMVSPLHEIDRDWAYHTYTPAEIKSQIKFWDLVHKGHELEGTARMVRVTIIYEETGDG